VLALIAIVLVVLAVTAAISNIVGIGAALMDGTMMTKPSKYWTVCCWS